MPKFTSIGNNNSNNIANSKNKVVINMRAGSFFGNTYATAEPVEETCEISLSFDCSDNSQYIPLI